MDCELEIQCICSDDVGEVGVQVVDFGVCCIRAEVVLWAVSMSGILCVEIKRKYIIK